MCHLPAWQSTKGKDLGGWPTTLVISGGSSNCTEDAERPVSPPRTDDGRGPPDKACIEGQIHDLHQTHNCLMNDEPCVACSRHVRTDDEDIRCAKKQKECRVQQQV